MNASAPAGYYDDGSGRLRYWDGENWTDRYQDQALVPISEPKASAAQAKAEKKEAAAAARAEKRAGLEARAAAAKAERAERKEAAAARKEADQAAFQARAGKLVKRGAFGGKQIEIYENGFVRIGGVFAMGTAPLEELRTITYRRNSRDKGAGGRAVGALATGGLNLLASKEKVQAFLSIATNVTVHQLSSSQASRTEENAAMALEAAGLSVIDMKRQAATPAPLVIHEPAAAPTLSAPAEKSVGEQIRELAALHSEGILSDEEFASAKARLLS